MKNKVITNLKTMQTACAEVIASGILEEVDDHEVRYFLYKLNGIVERVEKKPREIPAVKKEVWDNCDGL